MSSLREGNARHASAHALRSAASKSFPWWCFAKAGFARQALDSVVTYESLQRREVPWEDLRFRDLGGAPRSTRCADGTLGLFQLQAIHELPRREYGDPMDLSISVRSASPLTMYDESDSTAQSTTASSSGSRATI